LQDHSSFNIWSTRCYPELDRFCVHHHGPEREKAQIALPELRYMGFIISFDKRGHPVLNAEKSKTEAITNLPKPKNIKACRSFAGAVNYLSAFLPKLQDVLKPIYKLTRKNCEA
jgi:hypothetical protein